MLFFHCVSEMFIRPFHKCIFRNISRNFRFDGNFFFKVVRYIKFTDLIVQNTLVDMIRTPGTCSRGQLLVFRGRFPIRSYWLVQFPTGRDTGNYHPSPSTPAPPKITRKNTISYIINFRRINHNRTIITRSHTTIDNR